MGTHYATPEELVVMTVGVYGRCPPVVVVTKTGAHFGIGEQLSLVVAGRLLLVCEAVRQVCDNDLKAMCEPLKFSCNTPCSWVMGCSIVSVYLYHRRYKGV